MYQESLRDEATRRNISEYQVKKERNTNQLNYMKTKISELEKQNAALMHENANLRNYIDNIRVENDLLKLERHAMAIGSADSFITIPDIHIPSSGESDRTDIGFSPHDDTTNFVRLSYS
jgi:hypothetical protein